MKRFLGLLVLFLLHARAAEVVAWKHPLHHLRIADDPAELTPLVAPPEPSPFFADGDTLHDLRPLLSEDHPLRPLPLQWLVWNDRTGRIVAKADMHTLWQIHLLLSESSLPRQRRLTLSLHDVASDLAPPAGEPRAALSWISSQSRFQAAREAGQTSIEASGEIDFGWENPIDTLRLSTTVRAGDSAFSIDTSLSLPAGQRFWFARNFEGGHGVDLVLTASREFLDGTPASEACLLAHGGETHPVTPLASHRKHRLPDGRWLHLLPFHHSILLPAEEPGEVDPFSDPPPPVWRKFEKDPSDPALRLGVVSTPEIISSRVPWELLDITAVLKNNVPSLLEAASFAGYDPLHQQLVVLSEDDTLNEALLLGPDSPSPLLILTGKTDTGEFRLATLPGVTSRISSTGADGQPAFLFETNPTLGENEELFDLDLKFLDARRPGYRDRLEAHLILSAGRLHQVHSSLEIKGEIHPLAPGSVP